jgi:hypothetical protein
MKKSKLIRGLAIVAALAVAILSQGDAKAALAGKLSNTAAIIFSTAQDSGTASWDYGTAGTFSITLTDGSTANKANKIHVKTITTGTNFDLDAGTLVNPLGVAQAAFSRIVSIRVCAPAANTAAVAVGGDFILTKYLTGWVDDAATIPAHPGGCFLFTAPDGTGVAVTASTGDMLTVTPSGSETAFVTIIGS